MARVINGPLLLAIREQGYTQKEFSKIVGDDSSLISRVVNGHFNLDMARKIRWSKALKRKVEDLFYD